MAYRTIAGIPVWGEPLEEAVRQIGVCQQTATQSALMADHHVGYSMPIGGVCAYVDKISPSGVGYDISCGNKAVRTDLPAAEIAANIEMVMDDVWRTISFGIGMKNKERVHHPLFDDDPAWGIPVAFNHAELARDQLGTVGSGNHYVDLFVDEGERVWIGVHFGSRGFGHRIASHFMKAGGGSNGMHAAPVLFDADSQTGRDYIACMQLAGRYAYAGRDWVCDRVAALLGASILEEVHNHHNFAWRETHGGQSYWVVRKGATPAFPGQRGFIGGSMGDISAIVEGVDGDESAAALYSTVHGAGRVMSRTQAAGRRQWRKRGKGGKRGPARGGKISREMMMDWVRREGVELRGAGTDESPHCYKRLPEVLRCHAGTIRVLHTLRPIGVAMAGADEHDPYRD